MPKRRLLAALLAPGIALFFMAVPIDAVSRSGAKAPPLPTEEAAEKALDPGPRPKVDRNFPEILERVAARAAKEGNHKAAAVFYHRILEHEPHRRSARLGLADALDRQGRHAESVRLYREALADDPTDPSVRSRLGGALLAAGRPEEALPHLKAALESRRTVATLNRIGVAEILLRRPEAALGYFDQGREIRPEDRVLRNNAAIALHLSGRRDEAERLLSEDVRDRTAPDALRRNLMRMKMAGMAGAPAAPDFSLLSGEDGGTPQVIARIGEAPPQPRIAVAEAERPDIVAPAPAAGPEPSAHRPPVISGVASGPGKLAARRANEAPAPARETAKGAHRVAAVPTGVPPENRTGISEPLYRVQLGAFSTAGNAEAARRRVLRAARPLIEQFGIDVETRGSRHYKLQTRKRMGRAAAGELCAQLRSRSLDCFVARAPRG